jgi:4-hydroxybenzoate polyprenyltransferase
VPPAAWTVATGALLGVGAHLLNALPDLADDAATGVHGLPHRLGARRVRVLAPVVLVGATVVSVVGPAGAVGVRGLVTVVAAVLLGLVALRGSGRTPFVAAVLIAVLDVVSLVAR